MAITPPAKPAASTPPLPPQPGGRTQLDPPDDTARWFLKRNEAKPAGIGVPVTQGNKITPFIHYRDYYAAIGKAIIAAVDKEHFIYFCDWGFDPDTWVNTPIGRITLRTLFEEASRSRGVAIRALLYQGQFLKDPVHNEPHVKWINSLPTGGAIADSRYLNFGSHHQKMLVTRGTDGLIGFCGGMDLAEDRQLRDGGQSPPLKDRPEAWHDVQVRIDGPAAYHLWRTFNSRWLDHPLSQKSLVVNNSSLQDPPLDTPPGKGTLEAQVVRTYGNGSRHDGLAIWGAPSTYAFAPQGEMTIYKLLVKAIKETRYTIYLEDQYLVESERMGSNLSIGEVLASTIAKSSFEKMVILVPGAGGPQTELHQIWRRRVKFWQQLGSQAQQKVTIHAYKADSESPYLLHSKTWIFDDSFAVISSANSNRRGYSHDSEVGVGVADPNPQGDRLNFAHELRIALWLKHLNKKNPRVNREDLLNFQAAAKYWMPDPKSILDLVDLDRPSYSPPDSHLTSLPETIPMFSSGQFIQLRGLDWDREWDNFIDPDGS